MARKLTPTMTEAVEKARANGGKLVRLTGGFWTYPGCETFRSWPSGQSVPVWYVATGTIRALIDRKAAEVTRRAGSPGFAVEVTIP